MRKAEVTFTRTPTPREHLAFALDVPSVDKASSYIELLKEHVGVFKVGLELYTAIGTQAVRMVVESGCRCFLDIKLHDIPATMGSAVRSAIELGVDFITVHALSGPRALSEVAGVAQGTKLKILAVTLLTSIDHSTLKSIGIDKNVENSVENLALLALKNGIDGFVTSPRECATLRRIVGDDAFIVTPGIRPSGVSRDDQQRTATPTQAIRAGSNLLVVGRPIRNAIDPVAATKAVIDEIDASI